MGRRDSNPTGSPQTPNPNWQGWLKEQNLPDAPIPPVGFVANRDSQGLHLRIPEPAVHEIQRRQDPERNAAHAAQAIRTFLTTPPSGERPIHVYIGASFLYAHLPAVIGRIRHFAPGARLVITPDAEHTAYANQHLPELIRQYGLLLARTQDDSMFPRDESCHAVLDLGGAHELHSLLFPGAWSDARTHASRLGRHLEISNSAVVGKDGILFSGQERVVAAFLGDTPDNLRPQATRRDPLRKEEQARLTRLCDAGAAQIRELLRQPGLRLVDYMSTVYDTFGSIMKELEIDVRFPTEIGGTTVKLLRDVSEQGKTVIPYTPLDRFAFYNSAIGDGWFQAIDNFTSLAFSQNPNPPKFIVYTGGDGAFLLAGGEATLTTRMKNLPSGPSGIGLMGFVFENGTQAVENACAGGWLRGHDIDLGTPSEKSVRPDSLEALLEATAESLVSLGAVARGTTPDEAVRIFRIRPELFPGDQVDLTPSTPPQTVPVVAYDRLLDMYARHLVEPLQAYREKTSNTPEMALGAGCSAYEWVRFAGDLLKRTEANYLAYPTDLSANRETLLRVVGGDSAMLFVGQNFPDGLKNLIPPIQSNVTGQTGKLIVMVGDQDWAEPAGALAHSQRGLRQEGTLRYLQAAGVPIVDAGLTSRPFETWNTVANGLGKSVQAFLEDPFGHILAVRMRRIPGAEVKVA